MLRSRNTLTNQPQEPSGAGQPRSVEELLPESRPTRKNLEALIEEIRSGKYATSTQHRAEVLTKAGLMSTYIDMSEDQPITTKSLRRLLVEKGIYEEENSFWAAKNLWIALQSMGFITKQEDGFVLSKDFAPLYRRWKQLRERQQAQTIEYDAQHKQILAEIEARRAQTADATDNERQQARQARKEARQAAKEARIEAYKSISEEKANLRAQAEAKKEVLKAEKRMKKLDKKLASIHAAINK